MDGQGDIIYPPLVRPLVLLDKNGHADEVSALEITDLDGITDLSP